VGTLNSRRGNEKNYCRIGINRVLLDCVNRHVMAYNVWNSNAGSFCFSNSVIGLRKKNDSRPIDKRIVRKPLAGYNNNVPIFNAYLFMDNRKVSVVYF
jgi:hypothetical protein